MNIDKKNLEKMVEERYIGKQKHESAPLVIYNYTAKAQYEKMWNNETLQCRGLIYNEELDCIWARPFKKFFNFGESEKLEIPEGKSEVYDKLDGSLGILYWIGDIPYLATRGSFVSEQAQHGTEILRKKYSHIRFNQEYTYLFEIIYPKNRIVVDYKGLDDLILLAIIETKTGKEMPLDDIAIPIVKSYDGVVDFKKLIEKNEDNKEGFVVKWENGFRIKMKFTEYVRLHKLVTQVNAKTVWEMLKDKKSMEELLERVPDEFYKWAKKVIDSLLEKYKEIEIEAKEIFFSAPKITRKDFALFVVKTKYPAICFSLLDEKDYSKDIWQRIKPVAERPFKEEV